MRFRSLAIAAAALAIPLLAAGPAQALELEQIGSFAKPIYVTSDPGDAGRLFVVEREGTVELVEGGSTVPYLDLIDEVACCEGERGLSSIALSPDYATSHKLYVAYTTAEDTAELNVGDVVVDELTEPVDPEDPFASRRVLSVPHDQFNIHNAGQLQFGPDGMLYLSTGDGGLFNPRAQAQDVESGLGKILRFDPDATTGYDVPAGNPFTGSGFAPIVWALGLRNPFRFSFDRLGGDLVIGDVGEGAREEIDFAPSPATGVAGGAGDNYGWSCREGSLPGLGAGNVAACAGKGAGDFDSAVFEYAHFVPEPSKGVICSGSVIGGYVARDASLGDLFGRYVYADYCSGQIRALQLPSAPGGSASGDCSLGLPIERWNSFGEDADGRLYVASSKGGVYRFTGPLETCVPDAGANPIVDPTAPPGPRSAVPFPLPRPTLRISARSLDGQRPRVLLTVTVLPCDGQGNRRVVLLRGGEPNGSRQVGVDCEVRFRRGLSRRSSFRAELRPLAGEPTIRSRRLTRGPQ